MEDCLVGRYPGSIPQMLFTALHRELGLGPGPITPDMITEAVNEGIAETDDLDWKSKPYEHKGLPTGDFPKDVAAMANRGGGVLIFGVREQNKKATSIDAVEQDFLTENYARSITRAAITAISPPVFGVAVHSIATDVGTVLVVVVPASTDGPHLIYKNDHFGAPIRNGADTEWMKERQIEAQYRARFDAGRNAARTLEAMYDEAIAGRRTDKQAWFVGVAHPRLPVVSHERFPAESARQILAESEIHACALVFATEADHPLASVDRSRLRAGLRRWVAPNVEAGQRSWAESWVSVHNDGSVTVAAALGGRPTIPGGFPGNVVDSRELEAAVADLLGLVRATSIVQGIGEFDVCVGIESEHPDPLIIGHVNFNRLTEKLSTPLLRFTPVRATIRAGDDWDSFHQQARDLTLDCVNQGGLIQLRAFND